MLNIVDKISFRQRQILIHSYVYYHLNSNRISDKMYDKLAYELVDWMSQYPKEFMESEYYEIFKDFTGATGFDLVDKLTPKQLDIIDSIARYLIRTK